MTAHPVAPPSGNQPAAPEPPAIVAAHALVSELVAAGVRHFVLSPGSRSAPLAYAVAAGEAAGQLRLHVRLDERSAGYFAVGLSRQLRHDSGATSHDDGPGGGALDAGPTRVGEGGLGTAAGESRLVPLVGDAGLGAMAGDCGRRNPEPAGRGVVAVICTSGTAVANLHPAVLEADHARLPLLLLTADRPAELRGLLAS